MKKFAALAAASLALFCSVPFRSSSLAQVSHPTTVVVRAHDGSALTGESKLPYSPKSTCGACHDYDRITGGYHFQQGRTDGTGKIVIRDTFDARYPWNLSAGMYGRHTPASLDSSLLAKGLNSSPSEIDKSSFYFVQHCGPCHPGGGGAEFDRKGLPYYDEGSKKFGYELSGADPKLGGDYTSFAVGEAGFGAPWDWSGVSEGDCLLCHLKGYRWKDRAAALRGRFFKYGPAAGTGWAKVKLSQEASDLPRADEVTVDYSEKEVSDFERLNLQIVRKPPDENCWSCHAGSDGRQRGRRWGPESDVHNAKGLNCVSCHPGGREHNFAKGDVLPQTVRDDLDNTMPSCEDCHYRGKDKRAPRYRHPFSPRHLRRIACQTCHIPFQTVAADLVYDNASTGSTIVYDTPRFLSNLPTDPRKSSPTADPALWYPSLRDHKGKIVPVKSLVVVSWGDLDEQTNVIKPISLWKVRDLKKPPLKDDNGDGIFEINSPEEIKAFLKALKTSDRFGNPVAHQPVLLKAGFIYRIDKKGEVEKLKHDQAESVDFSLSHNVVSGPNVLGARGCKDCHARNSPFFLRKILVDPFDDKGKPVYAENWERLGIDREKLERLLLEQ